MLLPLLKTHVLNALAIQVTKAFLILKKAADGVQTIHFCNLFTKDAFGKCFNRNFKNYSASAVEKIILIDKNKIVKLLCK